MAKEATKKSLKSMTVNELKAEMIERYDGNAGEILNGFHEMGIRSQKKLKAAMIRWMERDDENA